MADVLAVVWLSGITYGGVIVDQESIETALEDAEWITNQVLDNPRKVLKLDRYYDADKARSWMECRSDIGDQFREVWFIDKLPNYLSKLMMDQYQEALMVGEQEAREHLLMIPGNHRLSDFAYSLRVMNLDT